jgi:hypothetical protein
MDESRLDLSALDPKRDPARFERLVRAVVDGARQPAPPAHWLVLDLVHLGGVAFLAAAVLAAISWLPSMSRRGAETGGMASAADPVALVSSWAYVGRVPSDVDPVQVLGVYHDR